MAAISVKRDNMLKFIVDPNIQAQVIQIISNTIAIIVNFVNIETNINAIT